MTGLVSENLESVVIPPPVNGWVTNQAISAMDPTTAIELVDLFPTPTHVELRKGYRYHSKGMGDYPIWAMIGFDTNSSSFLVASTSQKRVYNATAAASNATNITGAAALNDYVRYFQPFRNRLFMTTGHSGDDVYDWNGAGNIALSGFVGPSGDDKGLGCMTVYKSRIYFLEYSVGSVAGTSAWYGGVDAITGALTEFPFLSQLTIGGKGLFIGRITRAKDFSEDELFCFISSKGEVLVYQGDNPGAATWGILGHYFIPKPMGRNAFFYVGPDLHIMTRQGVISMAAVLAGDRVGGRYRTISENIDQAFTDNIDDSLVGDDANFGVNYPRGNILLVNFGEGGASAYQQYVMNTLHGAWCQFSYGHVTSACNWGDRLYMSNVNGVIYKADEGYFDEVDTGGTGPGPSGTKLRHAFNYFGNPRQSKRFVQARPIFQGSAAAGSISIASGVDVDYNNNVQTSAPSLSASSTETLYKDKMGLVGVGKCASYRIDAITADTLKLQATEIFFTKGDV